MELKAYQKEGADFAAARRHSLIADEMGLGKTAQAIEVINRTAPDSVLIICPASLKLNWQKELEAWLNRWYAVGICDGKHWPDDAEIVILNYDILGKHSNRLYDRQWGLIIVDEAHYTKNRKASRTGLTLRIPSKRRIFLTGTPLVNRPVELYPMLQSSFPDRIGGFWKFAQRYCGACHANGWDTTGATHLQELREQYLQDFMIRRLKKDVLAELPAKIRQVIELPAARGVLAAERELLAMHFAGSSMDQVIKRIDYSMIDFNNVSLCRHETALAKLPLVIEYLNRVLQEVDKVVVFAHHRDVIAALEEQLPNSAVLHGGTKASDRQIAVDRFQTEPSCRVFIGNIQAAGVGITLTAASHVVFAEVDWVPGVMSQAEDRCHRIGQTDVVNIVHLVLEGSIEAYMCKALINKQRVLDAILK